MKTKLFACLVFSALLLPQCNTPLEALRLKEVGAFSALGAQAGDAISFARLKQDILAHHIRSSEQLLEFFDKTPPYQILLKDPVLERESDAIHGDDVTPEFPRIVMHGGNLVMHLIGDPSALGRELVEISEYQPSSGRYAFSVINFAMSDPELMFLEDIEYKSRFDADTDAAYQRTVGRAFSCGVCHNPVPGTLLPIWSPLSSLAKTYSDGDDRIRADGAEAEEFGRFLEMQRDPELGKLYRRLKIHAERDAAGNYTFPNHPNQNLTKFIHDDIRARLAFQMQNSPRYPKLQYALFGAIFNCGNLEGFFSPRYRKEHEARLLDAASHKHYPLPLDLINVETLDPSYTEDVELSPSGNPYFRIPAGAKLLREGRFLHLTAEPLIDALKLKVLHSNTTLDFFSKERLSAQARKARRHAREADFLSPAYIETVAKLRYLFEGEVPGGFSPYVEFDLHGGHEHLSYRFDGGMEGLQALAVPLGPHFLRENPELDRFGDHHVPLPGNLSVPLSAYCADLKGKSLEAMQ